MRFLLVNLRYTLQYKKAFFPYLCHLFFCSKFTSSLLSLKNNEKILFYFIYFRNQTITQQY